MADLIRLDPRTRTDDLGDALQARVHDPLWLLARQLQLGAFRSSDGGTPARVELAAEASPLTRYRPGGDPGTAAVAYDPLRAPLEALVEHEPPPAVETRSLGDLVEAGLQFLRLLAAHGAGHYANAYRSAHPLAPPPADALRRLDEASARFVQITARRVLDAIALHRALAPKLGERGELDGPLPPRPAIAAADQQAVRAAARAWLAWFATQGLSATDPAAASAWLPSRMEYRFAVAAPTAAQEVVLTAPEYFSGELDWHSFDVEPAASLDAGRSSAAADPRTVIPAPVGYRGMPSARYWELEDAGVDFSGVEKDLDRKSVATLLLLEFALVYGNDWFLVPLELEVGSLCRIASLTVVDSFGEATQVAHASADDGPNAQWRMFTLSSEAGAPADVSIPQDVFFLAPALAPTLARAPVEDVLLVRDEMANLAWAVERVVPRADGGRLDRYEEHQANLRRREREAPPEPPPAGALRYRLGSEVPSYWIPLVPEEHADGVRLRRGTLPRLDGDGRTGPLGRILEPESDLRVYEEEVPREGARVARAYQFARWADGSAHLWLSRRKTPGLGEGSSGLRFDYAE
jgi:hypothetical protein